MPKAFECGSPRIMIACFSFRMKTTQSQVVWPERTCLSPWAFKPNGNDRWCRSMATWKGSPLMQCLVPMKTKYDHPAIQFHYAFLIFVSYSFIFTYCGVCFFQFPLYTLMVFDEWFNRIPVAYCITSKCRQSDLSPWMMALNDRLCQFQPDWRPNAFISDCAQA